MRLLIDGDSLVYRCGFAAEKTKYVVESLGDSQRYWVPFDNAGDAKAHAAKEGGVVWSRKEYEPLDHCLATVKNALHKIGAAFGSNDLEIWLSPGVGNFRDQIATRAKYKGNRDGALKPKYYKDIIKYLVERHGAKYAVGMEADDALAIGLTGNPTSICVSTDKDLLQVPGKHYNWVAKKTLVVNKKQAAFNLYTQVLAGDPTDNIPGIEGVGPDTAAKILEGAKTTLDLWLRTQDAYYEKYGNEGLLYAVETARLVYLKRSPEDEWKAPQ